MIILKMKEHRLNISYMASKILQIYIILYVSQCIMPSSECARILAHLPTPTYSHNVVYKSLIKELARRGHQVVSITTDPMRGNTTEFQNIKELDMSFCFKYWKEQFDDATDMSSSETVRRFADVMRNVANMQLEHPEVKALYNNVTEYFDLVLVEWIFYYPIYGWSHRFNAPMVGILSLDTFLDGHDFVGNIGHPYLTPTSLMYFLVGDGMTFSERLYSVWLSVYMRVLLYGYAHPQSDLVLSRHFGSSCPDVHALASNVSLVLLAAHAAWAPRAVVPAVVYFDSLHVTPPSPLPKHLQHYLDGSKQGVIYFSLGSNIKSSSLPVERIQMLLRAFAILPYNVLWKFEAESLPGCPNNVRIAKWVPQQDVLGHSNVLAFMTQGGVQSTEESVRCRVPLVVAPFFADQIMTARLIESKGIGRQVDFNSITSHDLAKTIRSVVEDKGYKSNVSRFATLLEDQMVPPMSRVMWHLEFVLRWRGLPSDLRSPAVRLPAWKILMLDMIAISLGFVVLVGALIICIVRKVTLFLIGTNGIPRKFKVS